MERKTLGAPPGPSRRQNTETDLINGVSSLTIAGRGNGRSGAGLDGGRAGRGSGQRGRTGGRGGRESGASGRGKEPVGTVAPGGGRQSGRGGRGRGRGRGQGWGAFGRGGRGKGKCKAVWRKKPEPRDWAGMPWDALSLIFEKIGVAEVLCSAQAVCRHWWLLAHDPRVWRIVNLRNADFYQYQYRDGDPTQLAIEAIDRSAGRLEEFSIGELGDDEILIHMSGRADRLRCLHLISCENITSGALADATEHFPLLEELEISFCYINKSAIATVGQHCPLLRCFRLNNCATDGFLSVEEETNNGEATLIANNMPKLQELQLLRSRISNPGILAILDSCPLLESLDIRFCWNVILDENLNKRLEKIKDLKLPMESLKGHPYYNEMGSYSDMDDYDDYMGDYGFGYDDFDDYDDYGLSSVYPEFQYGNFLGLDHDAFSDDELGLLIALGTLKNAMEDSTDDESD